jgi:4-amino-4-deoxy-L-arabinose transferase-like glycosyltransferase
VSGVFEPEAGSPRRASWLVLALIAVTGAARLGLAAGLGLSIDEAYTVTLARRFSLSYFDHPPVMYWLSGVAQRLSGSEQGLAVRWPFVVLFAATTWLLHRLATRLFDERAGLLATLLLNLVLFFTLNVGGWVLPDGPLLFCETAAVLTLARVLFSPPTRSPATGAWLSFGLLAGLALLSKYHGVFLLAGVGLFLVTSPAHRHWLRRPGPYLALAVTALAFSPVLFWNAAHDWASFRFQGGRAAIVEMAHHTPFLDTLGGQLLLMTPWIGLPLLAVFLAALRRGPGDDRSWFLACLAAGPVLGFNAVTAAGGHALPHWTAPGFFFLLPLLGAAAASPSRLARGWLRGSAFASLLLLAVLVTHAMTGWVSQLAPRLLAQDPTLDLLEWSDLPARLREWGAPGRVIAGSRWADAARIAHVLGPEVTVTSVGEDPRGFAQILDQRDLIGRDVLILASRRWVKEEPLLAYAPYFDRVEPLGSFSVGRSGRAELTVSAYLGRALRRPIPFRRRL